MIEHPNDSPVDLDEILSTALAQKEALLKDYPRLRPLQEEIDKHLFPEQPLAERFLAMGTAHFRWRFF